ncbi:alpha/beta hydrolase [Agromyces mediolanus]|uniref:alpha/beta fold hydrolase n=1 Tax=Agromyces mediolanus TaxID=41986 RepID=UPI00203D9DBD|nr:alpha/beta hydrolase [Agromyces mediolanus]MCM3658166.1 alpha/beta hydrolase [Agromyces mediolanus]
MPTLDIGGRSFQYEQSGQGSDIVWIGGGGMPGSEWRLYQTPAFDDRYRNTTFDNRGVGGTALNDGEVVSIGDFADDAAALIEALCDGPVICVGLSMGSIIAQELAVRRPDLVKAAVVMGTIARATGWVFTYMDAEIQWRKAGNRLSGAMGAAHGLAQLYPASALSDDEFCAEQMAYMTTPEYESDLEDSLIAQWQACNDYDGRQSLATCRVPLHVIGFEQDVQAPPRWGREVAELAPTGDFTLVPDAGHASCVGHKHHEINQLIADLIRPYND